MGKAPNEDGGYGYWNEQIEVAAKLYGDFQTSGDRVVDQYRIEKATGVTDKYQDRYNILYSSTETIRPSLYAETPKVEVRKRHRDRKDPIVASAVGMLESCCTYALEQANIDEVMENVIEDYALPGLGQVWVRYEPKFGADGVTVESENVILDYVHWKDLLFGKCRFWRELPWAARRVYMSKARAVARFGKEIAGKLQYKDSNTKERDRGAIVEDKQAVVWEIWDKTKRKVIWLSDGYDKVLEEKNDPLNLKEFWPFPKPLRAISNTRTFIPRPFYSQYQAQAAELDNLTQRIRILTEALQVRGVYDSSQNALATLLSPRGGNKLIPVENWHQFMGDKGINGSIQWVPIQEIAGVLMELYKARDIVKAEIYEISGFSDITRGLSKASETLGAQQIKNDWASARLRVMQKEVQRFVRDIVRIVAEIIAEHFTDESFALYSGFEVPADPTQAATAQQVFVQSVQMIRSERERCANIGIETDSTILPDEERERKDRLEFLGQMGAYLQQAGPMAMQYPQMGGLLMSMMMFTARTFRASRPLEQEFEAFQDDFKANPPQPPKEGDDGAAKAASAVQIAQMKQTGDAAKHDKELAFKGQQAELDRQMEREKIQAQREADAVQVQIKQAELRIKEVELLIKQAELSLKGQQAAQGAEDQAHRHVLEVGDQAHRHGLEERAQGHSEAVDVDEADRADRQLEADRESPQENGGAPLD